MDYEQEMNKQGTAFCACRFSCVLGRLMCKLPGLTPLLQGGNGSDASAAKLAV